MLNITVSVPSKFLTMYSSGSSESSLSGFAAAFLVNLLLSFFCRSSSDELEEFFLSFLALLKIDFRSLVLFYDSCCES